MQCYQASLPHPPVYKKAILNQLPRKIYIHFLSYKGFLKGFYSLEMQIDQTAFQKKLGQIKKNYLFSR